MTAASIGPYLIASYIGIPLFLAIFIGHKWKHRTRMLTLG